MRLAGLAFAAAVVLVADSGITAATSLPERRLTACLSTPSGDSAVAAAKGLAARLFSDIGVSVRWVETRACPFEGVRIRIWNETPAVLSPGAFGRSFPIQGTLVDIFYDRVRAAAPGVFLPPVLGHVLAHELGHVAQAESRHARQGLMKAHWEAVDLGSMAWEPLPFAVDDVPRVHRGLVTRSVRLRARLASSLFNLH
jgi:hypothetical protein